MLITVQMKDPDTMPDAVADAVKDDIAKMGLPPDEAEALIEARTARVRKAMDCWFEYDEYLRVVFDTEAMTATVVPVKDWR